MTSLPTNMPFVYNTMPTYPGAYLVNSGGGAHPIFCSIDNFNTWGFNDQDDYYIVMPGYQLTIFDNSGQAETGGTGYNYENRGSVVKYIISVSVNKASSCYLSFFDTSKNSWISINVSSIS